MRVLVIEDDPESASFIAEGLGNEGHMVEISACGKAGLLRGATDEWDVLIVDRMLPGIDGLSIVRRLHAAGIQIPTLFLTTMSGIDDRVAGLNAGADDYLVTVSYTHLTLPTILLV